jgi:hypothetical protein
MKVWDWFVEVIHKPLGQITLLELAGVLGIALGIYVVGTLLVAALFVSDKGKQ